MLRNITRELKKWKESPFRKPLIIYGARQVGKTYSILDFGKKEYSNVVYCNFENNQQLAAIFEQDLVPARIIRDLEAFFSTTIIKGQTLIVFDEIQYCELALTSLKYFNETANEYHIIAAGSLLGLAINRGHFSFPVGKIDRLDMYPLSFEEFLLATNNVPLITKIKESYSSFTPLVLPLHKEALELYRTYLALGGYPEVINKYLQTKDFDLVRSTQSSIANAYIADMTKYASPSDTIKCMAIYDSITAQFAKETTRFQYSVVDKKARAKTYELALEWLKTANVVLPVTKISEGKSPIKLYEDSSTFKIYYCDVGLFAMKSNIFPQQIIQGIGLADKAKGLLTENYVAQELSVKGYELHYWESNGIAEVDFIIQNKDGAIPLEVKSGDNSRSRSLATYTKKYKPNYAIRISTNNFGYENNIKAIPLYALFCL